MTAKANVAEFSSVARPANNSFTRIRIAPWMGYAAFFLVSLLAFGSSLWHEFVWDDLLMIAQNDSLRLLHRLPHLFVSPWFDAPMGLYRPLSVATFSLNRIVGGLGGWSWHFVNILLHAMTACVVVRFIKQLSHNTRLAWWTGAWFLVLPIHTEAVNAIVGRCDVLATLFSLLTLLALLKTGTPPSIWRLAGIGVLFLLALMSKEHAVAVLPMYLSWLIFDARGNRQPLRATLWSARRQVMWLLFALGLYLDLRLIALGPFAFGSDTHVTIIENPLVFLPQPQRIFTTLAIVSRYLEKTLWPATLSIDYGYNQIPAVIHLFEPRVLVGIGVMAALVWLAIGRWLRPRPWSAQQKLWSIAAMLVLWPFLPVSNFLIPIATNMGERLMYFPSVGLCLMLALAVVGISRGRWIVWGIAAALLGFYGWRCYSRTHDWRNVSTLALSTYQASPYSVRARTDWAARVVLPRDPAQAAREFQAAADQCPTYFHAVHNLGLAYAQLHRYDLAEHHFLRALQLEPETRIYKNLAIVYLEQGRYDRAMAALRLRFENRDVLVNTFLKGFFTQKILEAHAAGDQEAVERWNHAADEMLATTSPITYSGTSPTP